ncbi:MAG: hypothetical protein HY711_08280 [Candidatus Melainabacteria bacterium]|nr:hypothetical protein [Candidatus Melainabacteria bacterium]
MNQKLYDWVSLQFKQLAANDMDQRTNVLRSFLELERHTKTKATNVVVLRPQQQNLRVVAAKNPI